MWATFGFGWLACDLASWDCLYGYDLIIVVISVIVLIVMFYVCCTSDLNSGVVGVVFVGLVEC